MKHVVLAFLLFLSVPAYADEWRTADTWREVTYLTLHVIDWAQTRNISRNPEEWSEQWNKVLGEHPSTARVDRYFAFTAIAHIGIVRALPKEWRAPFQYVTISVEVVSDVHNYTFGIGARF